MFRLEDPAGTIEFLTFKVDSETSIVNNFLESEHIFRSVPTDLVSAVFGTDEFPPSELSESPSLRVVEQSVANITGFVEIDLRSAVKLCVRTGAFLRSSLSYAFRRSLGLRRHP